MIEFTIYGNHENKNGNPLPKARKTGRQQYTAAAHRYHDYLDYVRTSFIDQCAPNGRAKFDAKHLSFVGRKPLNTGDRKCKMWIFIEYGNNAHGDPENIFGAIADALFENDKYLAGDIDFAPDPTGEGRVYVKIEISETRCGVPTRKRKQVE